MRLYTCDYEMVAHAMFTLDKVTTQVDWLLFKQSDKCEAFLPGQTCVGAFPDLKVNTQSVTLAVQTGEWSCCTCMLQTTQSAVHRQPKQLTHLSY